MRESAVPTRVSGSRSCMPARCTIRSVNCSPCTAPVLALTATAIKCSAIVQRGRSASGAFPVSVQKLSASWVIEVRPYAQLFATRPRER